MNNEVYEIMSLTNNGRDLDLENLKRLNVYLDGYKTEFPKEEEVHYAELLGKARNGVFNTPWFHGVENMTMGGFKPEVQHLQPSKVHRCHHLVRPRPISNFSLKSASPLLV